MVCAMQQIPTDKSISHSFGHLMDSTVQPILSVKNLKTYYHQDEGIVRAVDGASFDVYAGKTLGIVGESGCGKSVTARSILRIVEETGRIEEGEILLRRQNPNGHIEEIDLTTLHSNSREIRAIRGGEIALIFQEPMTSFSAFHTVGNQIIEAIRLHSDLSHREARNQAIEMLQLVGIPRPERRIDEYSFQLSGGLRQRVMIAMALSSNPKVLIADEPTTALDVTTQAQILELLRRLQDEKGLAIILITHDMGVIAEMADDVVVMYLGRVVERGPVDQIFHEPRHPYTQSLLRSIPSILAAPRTKLSTISGSIPHPYNRPSGCPFHTRCPDYMAGTCESHLPELLPVAEAQHVSCFLYHPPTESHPASAHSMNLEPNPK
jgi:peptide/nickel transport system ATP-binding protein